MEINFAKIERKWQERWEKKRVFEVDESGKKKYYVLEMFAYPSGEGLHMGHAFNFVIGDVFARFKIMNGFNVLHPVGYDALGLPAENAAIKVGIHPEDYTNNNIPNFIKQQKGLGLSYDWSRIINTADSSYYKWDQWIFLKMLEKGLAYQKVSAVNWCPKCNSVLANEQVSDGKCWIHDDCDVEVRNLKQWFLKTTAYADELYSGLDKLTGWPEKTLAMQRNWIGRSCGTEIDFVVSRGDGKIGSRMDTDGHRSEGKGKTILVDAVNCLVDKEGNVNKELKKYLDSLPNRKIVLTNASLKKYDLYFKNIQDYEIFTLEFKPEKENPEYYKKALKKFGLKSEEVVYFEHGKEAVESAKSIGIDTLFYNGDVDGVKKFIDDKLDNIWSIFTTRPDTIFGVTFMVVSAQHSRLDSLVTKKQRKEVEKFLSRMKSVGNKDVGDLEKEGFFSGSYAVNPANGERVPIWVGNFVVADYGSGMVMGVPAHDQRDFEFAKKYGIEVREVVRNGNKEQDVKDLKDAFTGAGILVNSGEFDGLDNEVAKRKITAWLEKKGVGRKVVNFKLRDWGISRQRYWGTPIPVVYCEECKKNAEENSLTLNFYNQEAFENLAKGLKTIETRAMNPDEKDRYFGNLKKGDSLKCVNKNNSKIIYLEILGKQDYKDLKDLWRDKNLLSEIFPGKEINSFSDLEKEYSYASDYLDRIKKNGLVSWKVRRIVPGVVAVPEKNLPVELPKDVKFGKGNPLETNEDWLNVKCPKCDGRARRESDTMDTFVNSSWYFMRYCDVRNKKKIFDVKKVKYWCPVDFYVGGAEHACMHLIYSRFYVKFLRDLGLIDFDEPAIKLFHQGMINDEKGEKMSKSKGNVVEPLETMAKYGVDTTRYFLLSMASPDKGFNWSDKEIAGAQRFIRKVFEFYESNEVKDMGDGFVDSNEVLSRLDEAIVGISENIENMELRAATIKLKELFKFLAKEERISIETRKRALKLLVPFCPHIAEEIWEHLRVSRKSEVGSRKCDFVSLADWPKVDEPKIQEKREDSDLNGKIVEDVKNILAKVDGGKVYVYVMPFEIGKIDVEKISKEIEKDVKVFAVNDSGKYDPEGKAKKAKPGKAAIYLQ